MITLSHVSILDRHGAGLSSAIHALGRVTQDVDARVKPAHDGDMLSEAPR